MRKKYFDKAFLSHQSHVVKAVNMLGIFQALKFEQKTHTLEVALPGKLPSDYAICLKIVPELNLIPKSLSKF